MYARRRPARQQGGRFGARGAEAEEQTLFVALGDRVKIDVGVIFLRQDLGGIAFAGDLGANRAHRLFGPGGTLADKNANAHHATSLSSVFE